MKLVSNGNHKGLDVYIKDERHADVRFLTPRSKRWAHDNGLENIWSRINDSEAWNPKTGRGIYKTGINILDLPKLMKLLGSTSFLVCSEF